MEKEKIVLRTYNSAWKFERKIYAIDKVRLLVPVNLMDAAYFCIGFAITLALLRVFPFLGGLPFVIRYFLLPFILMKFLTKKKFDGKLPHKFLLGYFEYLTLPKQFSKFQMNTSSRPGHFTSIVYRNPKLVNVMDQLTTKEEKRHVRFSG